MKSICYFLFWFSSLDPTHTFSYLSSHTPHTSSTNNITANVKIIRSLKIYEHRKCKKNEWYREINKLLLLFFSDCLLYTCNSLENVNSNDTWLQQAFQSIINSYACSWPMEMDVYDYWNDNCSVEIVRIHCCWCETIVVTVVDFLDYEWMLLLRLDLDSDWFDQNQLLYHFVHLLDKWYWHNDRLLQHLLLHRILNMIRWQYRCRHWVSDSYQHKWYRYHGRYVDPHFYWWWRRRRERKQYCLYFLWQWQVYVTDCNYCYECYLCWQSFANDHFATTLDHHSMCKYNWSHFCYYWWLCGCYCYSADTIALR